MSKIKYVLFDCDGVLVDTEYSAAVKMTNALQALNVVISVEYYLQNLSGSTFSSIAKRYLGSLLSDHAVHGLVDQVEDEVAAEVKLIEGVGELLSNLAMGKSVVSNSSISTVENALKVTGIRQYFSTEIFSSELVNRPKPAPDIYQLAVTSLGYNTSEIMVIEDSISGTQAALAAGLQVIGFTGGSHILAGHKQRLLALGVTQVASSMKELGSKLAVAQGE